MLASPFPQTYEMLTKRFFILPKNYKQLTFASKFKPVGSLCHIRAITDGKLLLNKESLDTQHKLFKTTSASLIMELLEFNFSDRNLNSNDTITTLTKLLQLCSSENLRPEKVVHVDFFKNLCNLINTQTNELTLREALEVLEYLCELKVDLSSDYILHLLDRIHTLLNTASFYDYNRIMQIIDKMPSFPSTKVIRSYLKKDFDSRISNEFDKNDFKFLLEAFRYAYLYRKDKEVLKKVVNALRGHNFDTASPHSILLLMDTLNSVRPPLRETFKPTYARECDEILVKAQNAFIKNISQIKNEDIIMTLKKLSIRIREHKLQQFYNKHLFDKAIEELISTKFSLEEGIECLRVLLNISHKSTELLTYLSNKIGQKIELTQERTKSEKRSLRDGILFTMLDGFAEFKYKPDYWEPFSNSFKSLRMLNYETDILLFRAYHLACLNCYDLSLLEKIFENDFDFKKYPAIMHHTYLKLYQKLKTAPDYSGPLPSKTQVESFKDLMCERADYPLYDSLTEALGGPEYVKSNIATKLYHQIDHVIAFQPGGDPLAINDIKMEENSGSPSKLPIENLEDLSIPENCQVIAVMHMPFFWCTRNTGEILGTYSTYIETLQTLSCRVVAVRDKEWRSLPKNSRAALLMNLIRKTITEQKTMKA